MMIAETAVQEFTALEAEMNSKFLEREVEIKCILTALVAEQHVLLLGPPGTAKSLVVKAITNALGGNPFNLLMTRFTTPDEVFGPVSLKGLENDVYRRVTAGYFPEAEVAFLDEIFKANSPILNALLTALNERAFDNGGKRESLPLEVCVGASNELPQEASLAALYDRFMLRCWVTGIKDEGKFTQLLSKGGATAQMKSKISREGLKALRGARKKVDVSEAVPLIVKIRSLLAQDHGIEVSDRRWVACVKLVKASAAISGRAKAIPEDVKILEHALWDQPEDQHAVKACVLTSLNVHMAEALKIVDACNEVFQKIDFTNVDDFTKTAGTGSAIIRKSMKRLEDIQKKAQSKEIEDMISVLKGFKAQIKNKLSEVLGG